MDLEYSFDIHQFELLEKIGKGGFGVVHKIKDKKTGNIYAAKVSLISFDEEEEAETPKSLVRNVVREINIISKLNHPSIVKFIGFSPYDFEGNFKPIIVSEYVSKGTLAEVIKLEKKGRSDLKWDSTQKLITLYGIASAMSFLHEHKIIHRDLKPENIMMDEDLNPKVTDFGLSKIIHSNQDSLSLASTIGFKGTLLYSSPEIMFENNYTEAGDVYSFSMIAYEVLTTEKPFIKCNLKELMKKLNNAERPVLYDIIPDSYKSLIQRCWAQNPSDRPTFNEIVKEMKENPGFITDLIDENKFLNYVDYVNDYKIIFNAGKPIVSINDFIKNKTKIEENINFKIDENDANSIYKYGMMLVRGKGVKKNLDEAIKYFKKGAEKGHVKCMVAYEEMRETKDENVNSTLIISKIKQLQVQKLYKSIISEKKINHSDEVKSILNGSTMNEIDLLKVISNNLKITPDNVITILNNSNGFDELQEACEFYLIIIERSEIKQQNFLNLETLNYLLTNLDESNVVLYSIYANLFLSSMDLSSFYRIVVTACLRKPKYIYEISCFIYECYSFHKNNDIIKEAVCNFYLRYLCKWEIHTLECFLDHFKLINIKRAFYENPNLHMKKGKMLHEKSFQFMKNKAIFDPLYKYIIENDVDKFIAYQSSNGIDMNGSIIHSLTNENYWPFGNETKIKIVNLAAFAGSVLIFNLLISYNVVIEDDLFDYAIAGGNSTIIQICKQKYCKVTFKTIEIAIRYHRNDILKWLIENYKSLFQKNSSNIYESSFYFSNPQAFMILQQYGFDFNFHPKFSFMCFDKEWIKYFVIIESFKEKTMKYIQKINSSDDYYFKNALTWRFFNFSPICKSFQIYLQEKGILDQYNAKQVLPPYPNNVINNIYRKLNNLQNYSDNFIIFLCKNHMINFYILYNQNNDFLSFDFLWKFILVKRKYKLFDELRKYDPTIGKKLFDHFFPGSWLHFITNHYLKDEKDYFFESCLFDIQKNLSFQTEGFVKSCFYGDYIMFNHLYHRKFVDVDSRLYYDGRTAFLLASQSNHIKIVEELLSDTRINVNTYDSDHKTSLFYACEYNYRELVDMFLNNKRIDINIPDKSGKSPFFIACEKGHSEIVKLFLSRNDVVINSQCYNGSPFGLAVENWHYKVVKLLIDNDKVKFIYPNEENPLHRACLRGSLKMVELLLSMKNKEININQVDKIFIFN